MYPAVAKDLYLLLPVYYHQVSHYKKDFTLNPEVTEKLLPYMRLLWSFSFNDIISAYNFRDCDGIISVLYFKDVGTFHILLLFFEAYSKAQS